MSSAARPRGARAVRWLNLAVLGAGLVAFVVKGADQPADPYLGDLARRPAEGFGEIAYRVNRTAESTRCALLAEAAMQHSRGLNGQPDLGGYDGMLFLFPADTRLGIPTRNTALALSTAFFDAGGRFVSSADSEPCPDRADCPAVTSASPFRYALQVPKGDLGPLGVQAGSVISVGGPCP